MTPKRVDIVSGFLGAGKTTFIQYLFSTLYKGKKIAVIENDFGDVGIDGRILGATGSKVTEIISGCICCTLIIDFQKAIEQLAADPEVERIVIEPSGVAKLSDVLRAAGTVSSDLIRIGHIITVVDAVNFVKFSSSFGPFFIDQIENAGMIVVSKTGGLSSKEIELVVGDIKRRNKKVPLWSLSWDSQEFSKALSGLDSIEVRDNNQTKKAAKDHHHQVDGDTVFDSIVLAVPPDFTSESLRRFLEQLEKCTVKGEIIRMKGFIKTSDLGPVQTDWAAGTAVITPTRQTADNVLQVIGVNLSESELKGMIEELKNFRQ